MKPNRHIPWQRLTLSLLGLAVLALHWRWAVEHLYSLPSDSMGAFGSITVAFMGAAAAIVIFMVTGAKAGAVQDIAAELLRRPEENEK